jgi:type II secretory pathway pseudopilin PulG
MLCQNCGSPLISGTAVCSNCGQALSQPPPQFTANIAPTPLTRGPSFPTLRRSRNLIILLIAILALSGALVQSYTQNVQLQSQNASLESRLTVLENEANNYYAQSQTYQNQNGQLITQVSSLQAQNTYLSNQVQQLNLQTARPTLTEWGCSGICQMSGGNGWSMDATGARIGGVPDTFTYSPSYQATILVGVFYLTLEQYVQFANCASNSNAAARISCVTGTYYEIPQTTSLAHGSSVYSCIPGGTSCTFFSYDFHLAEGCASYLALFFSTQAGTIYPDQTITYNPASVGTGACA